MQKLSPQRLAEIQHALEEYDVVELNVVSGSMLPLIGINEKILVQSIHKLNRELEPFDIILFLQDQILLCHYVAHINFLPGPDGRRFVTTQGLSSPGEDLPVYYDQILGTVVSHQIKGWSRWRLMLKSWRGQS